ncbi:MAG: hypothetical protein HC792_01390 [Acaryochloridaceae cyanobacterium CSU_5_19]|nr:hypothetical protein [Acaryochloridaceae cyanobacterium CSU_5_19]
MPKDRDNRYEIDAKIAAFGTTSIGNWLLTGAVNSARPLNTNCTGDVSLFQASGTDCDYNNYTVYGDDSSTDIIAPSTDNVFVRIERTSPVPGAGSDYLCGAITIPKNWRGLLSFLVPLVGLYMALKAITILATCN